MKYYLNNRDNRANLAANDFDEFFRPFWSMGEFSRISVLGENSPILQNGRKNSSKSFAAKFALLSLLFK